MVASRDFSKVCILKPKVTNKLAYLDDNQHQQLCTWLLKSGKTYHEICELIEKEFQIHCTPQALTAYFRKYISAYLITMRQRNVEVVMGVNSDLTRNPAEFVAPTIDNVARLLWQQTNDPHGNPKTIKILGELILRFREQDIKRESLAIKSRRLDWLERRAREAEDAVSDGKLSAAELAERMRRIFRRDQDNGTNGHTKPEAATSRIPT